MSHSVLPVDDVGVCACAKSPFFIKIIKQANRSALNYCWVSPCISLPPPFSHWRNRYTHLQHCIGMQMLSIHAYTRATQFWNKRHTDSRSHNHSMWMNIKNEIEPMWHVGKASCECMWAREVLHYFWDEFFFLIFFFLYVLFHSSIQRCLWFVDVAITVFVLWL